MGLYGENGNGWKLSDISGGNGGCYNDMLWSYGGIRGNGDGGGGANSNNGDICFDMIQ